MWLTIQNFWLPIVRNVSKRRKDDKFCWKTATHQNSWNTQLYYTTQMHSQWDKSRKKNNTSFHDARGIVLNILEAFYSRTAKQACGVTRHSPQYNRSPLTQPKLVTLQWLSIFLYCFVQIDLHEIRGKNEHVYLVAGSYADIIQPL